MVTRAPSSLSLWLSLECGSSHRSTLLQCTTWIITSEKTALVLRVDYHIGEYWSVWIITSEKTVPCGSSHRRRLLRVHHIGDRHQHQDQLQELKEHEGTDITESYLHSVHKRDHSATSSEDCIRSMVDQKWRKWDAIVHNERTEVVERVRWAAHCK